MADTQNLMFSTLFAQAMTMLKDLGSLSHDQYDSFDDYMTDTTTHWKRVRSLLEMCRELAEEIDSIEDDIDEIEELEDIDDDEDDYDDDESVADNTSVHGQNL